MFDSRRTAEIAEAFGLGEPLSVSGPTARGEQGQIFRLETASGSWAIKELFGATGGRDMLEAAAFQDAAEAAGVLVPHVMRTSSGDVAIDVGDAAVRAYRWLDLRDPDPQLEAVALGQLVATLHRIEFAGLAPVDPWYVAPVGAGRWARLERELTAADAPFAADFAALRPEFVGLEALLTPPKSLRTCHRDLFADNLRMTEAGDLCVIDWDDYGLADPAEELCLILFEFGRSDSKAGSPTTGTDLSRVTAIYQAYVEGGGPARVTGRGDFSMVIAQLGHLTERGAARWLAAPPGDPERARMVSLFDEVLAYPLTRNLIDGIVEAVSG